MGAALYVALIPLQATGCATHNAGSAPHQLKSDRPKRNDKLPDQTKPELPPDKPVEELPIEELRPA